MSACGTCHGYGLTRGGRCWTCKGSGSAPTPRRPLDPDAPSEAMISAGLKVDWSNEDERASVINVWYAMSAVRGEEAPAEGDGIDPVIRAAMYRSHVPLNEDRLIKSAQALVTACHRADEREELDEEIDGSMLDDVEEAIAELLAARNRTSEPEAIKQAYKRGWNDRESDIIERAESMGCTSEPEAGEGVSRREECMVGPNTRGDCSTRAGCDCPAPATADKLRVAVEALEEIQEIGALETATDNVSEGDFYRGVRAARIDVGRIAARVLAALNEQPQ